MSEHSASESTDFHIVNRPEVNMSAERDGRPRRQTSTIQFPYSDLASVENLADVLHNQRGGRCDSAQLAGSLGQAATSGAFRLKVSAAAMYGLITSEGGQISITPLGKSIITDDQRAAARVQAFKAVPLYDAVFREYRLGSLPDDAGIEAFMIRTGVTPNQASRARQIFMRSAEQAGFFAAGRSRLVEPTTGRLDGASERGEAAGNQDERERKDEVSVLADPMLTGLFNRLLPAEGKPFPARDRQRLLRSFAVTLDAIYGEPDDGELDVQAFGDLFKPVKTEPSVTSAPSLTDPASRPGG